MMTDDHLHLQVKTIETELSRAQSCLANGDVHASQLHQLFAMSTFLSLMAALPTEKSGKLGRREVSKPAPVPLTVEAFSAACGNAMRRIMAGERYVGPAHAAVEKSAYGMCGLKLQLPPGATVDMEAVKADDVNWWNPDPSMRPVPAPTAPTIAMQTTPVRQSLRWEHTPDEFGGKMCLFVGAFGIIGIQQDEDDSERAYYYPTTSWYHLENTIEHWPSSILRRDDNLDQLMRTPEAAMRWTEEQLKLPVLPTWIDGEQVTLAAPPEPQEPYWKESSHQPDFWILYIGNHQIGAVTGTSDDKWFIDGVRHSSPYSFDGAREVVESANGLRPCRVIR
jgi:hypothetical protein